MAIVQQPSKCTERFKKYKKNDHKIATWKKHKNIEGVKNGPKNSHSKNITELQKQICVAWREMTRFLVDNCFDILQLHMPRLSRPASQRLFMRHDISSRPKKVEAKI